MEIHRHPALTRMWAPVGQRPQVPTPGQNEKVVVNGGIDYKDYKTGKLTYTIAQTKCGAEFLAFLVAVAAKYAGSKIWMVCDNGWLHHTKPVQLWLEAHREQIEVFWLPPHSPSLTLIERF